MLFKLPDAEEATEVGLKALKIGSLGDVGWNEKDLENLLANNITQFIREEYLMTISQERPMQEEPDIMALDKDGILYIFELKGIASDESNLLQVLRYGQKYGIFDYERLNHIYNRYLDDGKEHSLREEHSKYFDLDEELSESNFNKNQKFIIITAGLDFRTLRSIRYWMEKKLPVEALTYRIYEVGKEYVIDFDPYGPKDDFDMVETSNHIVNTNWSCDENCVDEMLQDDIAAAYGNRKTTVDSIQKGDRVFLYHTGVGICAVGRAIGDVEEKDWDGVEGDEHYVQCSFDVKIDPEEHPERALSAREINESLDLNWSFRQTRFSPPNDEIADNIEKMFKEKQKKSKED